MALRSTLYDDIYFSPEDGVAESEYVYIKGNHLPDRFRAIGRRPFVVGELGFGAGLNFLLTVRAFLENA
ncbi:partial tRNA 5-methylaminomethyl-2-thiouridine biosynthesis bifunctional protein MnmC, partial [uncultured bacterium]